MFGDMEPCWMDVTPVTPTGHSPLHVFCGMNNSLDQDQLDIFAIESIMRSDNELELTN